MAAAMNRSNSQNAEGVYEPFAAEEVDWVEWSKDDKYACRYRPLSDFGGASHVGVVIEELPPGRQSNLVHFHMLEEEHVLVLSGSMTLLLGDRRYELSAGDYVCFPAAQAAGHALVNNSGSVCRYVLIGERNPHDVIVYPQTGRVSVRLTGEGYRKSAVMDYWEEK